MELYELKYFLGVARFENIHRAAEKLHVSTGSLSKAVARLEEELGVNLFLRERRQIRLTDEGKLLQKRAAEMVQFEESLKQEITGKPGALQIILAGPEILLAKMGTSLAASIRKRAPDARFEFQATTEEVALARVDQGDAHIALLTGDMTKPGLTAKTIAEAKFQTYVGRGHSLHAAALAQKTVPVQEVLEHSFASPDHPLLGKVGARQSLDGWRDDQFARRVDYLTSSLKILEELVVSGRAIAYLPSYFCENLDVAALKISGCPYTCVQKIKLVAKNPKNRGWMQALFS